MQRQKRREHSPGARKNLCAGSLQHVVCMSVLGAWYLSQTYRFQLGYQPAGDGVEHAQRLVLHLILAPHLTENEFRVSKDFQLLDALCQGIA